MPVKQFLNTSSWTSHDFYGGFFFLSKLFWSLLTIHFLACWNIFTKKHSEIVQFFSSMLLACGCEKTATWHSDSKKINIDTICRYHFETEKRKMEHLIIGIFFETIFWHIDVKKLFFIVCTYLRKKCLIMFLRLRLNHTPWFKSSHKNVIKH